MNVITRKPSLWTTLVLLTLLFLLWQFSFFYVHYHVASLMDSLAQSPLVTYLYKPFISLPLLSFFFWHMSAYIFLMVWAWFVANELGEIFFLKYLTVYFLGIALWLLNCLLLLTLNHYYYPNSFFAQLMDHWLWLKYSNNAIVFLCLCISINTSLLAFANTLVNSKHRKIAAPLMLIVIALIGLEIYNKYLIVVSTASTHRPNVLIIGLDSIRPDYITKENTPNIYRFLSDANIFKTSYTPLARTFPSWVSILTAKFPKHNAARFNLEAEGPILQNDMLSHALQRAGYFTMYGTDEPRFTDIDQSYGFDKIIGPKGKAVEFLIGALSDFPIVNLLSNISIGQMIFPYNYANRATEFSYQPDNFLNLVKKGLSERPKDAPLFLALHLCISHWPFTWAQAEGNTQFLSDRYLNSVKAVDKQFEHLLSILNKGGILKNSLVFVLSDHGVTLGLPHDRLIEKLNYVGDEKKLPLIRSYKYNFAPDIALNPRRHININTSYGQGTDVLSLKQYKILLAMKNTAQPQPGEYIYSLSSTIDVAPTILDYLKLPPMQYVDGISLLPALSGNASKQARPFYLETADTIADIESDKLFIDKIVKKMINAYELDLISEKLYINPLATENILKNKQRAIIMGDWMLAHYPAQTAFKLQKNTAGKFNLKPQVAPDYFVIANIKTGFWTIDFEEGLPNSELLQNYKVFFGDEV